MTAQEYDEALTKIAAANTAEELERVWNAELKELVQGTYAEEVSEQYQDKLGFLTEHGESYEGKGIFADFDL